MSMTTPSQPPSQRTPTFTLSARPAANRGTGISSAVAATAGQVRYVATPIFCEFRIQTKSGAVSEAKVGKDLAHMETLSAFHQGMRDKHKAGVNDKVTINTNTLLVKKNGVIVETLSSNDPEVRAVRDAVQGILGLKEKMWDSYKEGERSSGTAPEGFSSKNKRQIVEFSTQKQLALLESHPSHEKLYRVKRHKVALKIRDEIAETLEALKEKALQDTTPVGKRRAEGIEKVQQKLGALNQSAIEFEAYHPLARSTNPSEKRAALERKEAAAAAWISESPMPRGWIFAQDPEKEEDKALAKELALMSITDRAAYEEAHEMLKAERPTRAGGEALLIKLAADLVDGEPSGPVLMSALFGSFFSSLHPNDKQDLTIAIQKTLAEYAPKLRALDDQDKSAEQLIQAVDAALAPPEIVLP